MSLSFKAKIADSYSHLKPVTTQEITAPVKTKSKKKAKLTKTAKSSKVKIVRRPWTTLELKTLIDLRAEKVCDKKCAVILDRTAKSCRMAIWGKKLLPEIKARRLEIGREL